MILNFLNYNVLDAGTSGFHEYHANQSNARNAILPTGKYKGGKE